jgi:ribosomal-protein-alanine N-acetyltransferase
VYRHPVDTRRLVAAPELETARLRLRGWRDEDIGPMAAINDDVRVGRWLGGVIGRDQTQARMAAWVDHWQEHGFGLWAVDEKATGQMVGRVGLMHHDDWTASTHDAEIGWAFAPEVWNRGYATEAALAVLEWARGRAGLRTIVSITRPDNVRSRRVMDKLGLAYVGQTTWRGFEQVWYVIDLLGQGPY